MCSGVAERSERRAKLEFCPSFLPSNARIFAKKRPSFYINEPVWRIGNTASQRMLRLFLAPAGALHVMLHHWRFTQPQLFAFSHPNAMVSQCNGQGILSSWSSLFFTLVTSQHNLLSSWLQMDEWCSDAGFQGRGGGGWIGHQSSKAGGGAGQV